MSANDQNANSPVPLRVVVVDDSALYRLLIRDVLKSIPGCVVVDSAKNGKLALEVIEKHQPDVVTLDVEMPELDGIQTLRAMKQRGLDCRTIMVSRLTDSGAETTTDALLEGAFDFVLKPSGGSPAENKAALREALQRKISVIQGTEWPEATESAQTDTSETAQLRPPSAIGAVIVGTSTGGPDALRRVVPRLSSGLGVPVVVIQHMPEGYTTRLARRLNEASAIDVREAQDGDEPVPGLVLLAPGGRQLKLVRQATGRVVVQLTDDPPEHGCHPAVDYTLRSAVEAFQGQVMAVIMTGMGRDGTDGCRLVRDHGGQVIAQHADGCVVYGMPGAVISRDLADRVIRLDSIAAVINQEVRSSVR